MSIFLNQILMKNKTEIANKLIKIEIFLIQNIPIKVKDLVPIPSLFFIVKHIGTYIHIT